MEEGKTERCSVSMTPNMRARLQQLIDKHPADISLSDLIRQAIREYLDRQEDVIGSRAHFRKSFQLRIDDLQSDMTFQVHMLLNLLAHGLAAILPAFTEEAISVEELIQAAMVAAHQNADVIQAQVEVVRHD